MLAPHELKTKGFSKSLKGYNAAEVDDYIEFLLEKYTEAYRENIELDRKLRVVVNTLEEIKDEEEAIRSTLLSAQKMGEKIIREANERADIITGAIKDRCDLVIADFKEELRQEKEEMWSIRTRILDFKKNVFDIYRKHIEELQDLSVNEIEEIVLPDEDKIVSKIFTEVKTTIEQELQRAKEEGEMAPDPAALTTETEAIPTEVPVLQADEVDETEADHAADEANEADMASEADIASNSDIKDSDSEEDEFLKLMQEED